MTDPELFRMFADKGSEVAFRKVDAALVRLPDASHGMAGRPSFLISKVVHILKWFEIHRTDVKK